MATVRVAQYLHGNQLQLQSKEEEKRQQMWTIELVDINSQGRRLESAKK